MTTVMKMMAAAAFGLVAGNAQAYEPDYDVQHVNARSEKTGEVTASVTFTSALDHQNYFISEDAYREAQAEGANLGRLLAYRVLNGYATPSLLEMQTYAAVPAMRMYNDNPVFVKFYVDVAIEAANNESARLIASNVRPSNAGRPSNAEASAAMDRLQDAKGKPHVKGGVWYDRATDTYHWVGPKFGRQMSEPAAEFLAEVGLDVLPIESPLAPPSIDQSDTDWALANAARIEAAKKAKAAAGPTKEELASAAHDAKIRADNERALKSLPPKTDPPKTDNRQ